MQLRLGEFLARRISIYIDFADWGKEKFELRRISQVESRHLHVQSFAYRISVQESCAHIVTIGIIVCFFKICIIVKLKFHYSEFRGFA